MQAECRFATMGSLAHLVVVGSQPCEHLAWARARLEQLEAAWTRFDDHSEVSQLNSAAGHPLVVSADTFRLVSTAVAAWERTRGSFDPTLVHALVSHGYDRTFTSIDHPEPAHGPVPLGFAAGIELVAGVNAVTLPIGTGLDPGGIGKGLAADIVVEELLARGADGAMVNLGGDIRADGTAPDGADGWTIGVDDPFDSKHELLRITVPAGAVATSSRLKRQWATTVGTSLHHLLDARTGEPIDNDIAAVTVVAGAAWWAEALSKAVFTAGISDGFDQLTNASAVIVDLDGNRYATADLESVLR